MKYGVTTLLKVSKGLELAQVNCAYLDGMNYPSIATKTSPIAYPVRTLALGT